MVKRAIDIFGSLLALIVLSPVFLAIALLVKLTSKGPVLFRLGCLSIMAGSSETSSRNSAHMTILSCLMKSTALSKLVYE